MILFRCPRLLATFVHTFWSVRVPVVANIVPQGIWLAGAETEAAIAHAAMRTERIPKVPFWDAAISPRASGTQAEEVISHRNHRQRQHSRHRQTILNKHSNL
uniref:Secreted protein n=1 Tax=Ixodes ricinus TaxID=34613 RepID=A0A6B0U6W9_IXORI